MADFDNIELRSEKTRRLIGANPSGIVGYGTLLLSAVIIATLAATYFIPYPNNLQVPAKVIATEDALKVHAYIPYSYASTIYEGMKAMIEFEGYPASDYGYLATVILFIDKDVQTINNQNVFTVILDVRQSDTITLTCGMNGTANILISNKSLLQMLLKVGST